LGGEGEDEGFFSTSGDAAEDEAASETPGARRWMLRRSSCVVGSLRRSSGGEKAGARVEEWSKQVDEAILFLLELRRGSAMRW
jgi:hypothetical protein